MDSFKEEKVPESSTDGNTGGRSYECSFCKRGFTNAQALGGHMNIHRKDKAKANKQVTKPPSSNFSNPSRFNQPNHDYVAQISRNQFYFQLPNPSRHDPPHVSHAVESNSVNLGVNLSLEMGPSSIENEVKKSINVMREERMEHEVDLELRLGHDP